MEKVLMEKIKNFVIQECQDAFSFAGVAEGDNMVMINSGNDKELIIKLEIKED